MKSFGILLIVLILFPTVFAQSNSAVKGKLISNGSQTGNQKVILYTQTRSYETVTDAEGNYSFENIPDGSYLLKHGNRNAGVRVKNGEVTVSNFGEVIVISTGASQPLSRLFSSASGVTS